MLAQVLIACACMGRGTNWPIKPESGSWSGRFLYCELLRRFKTTVRDMGACEGVQVYIVLFILLSVRHPAAGAGMFSPQELPVCPGDEATFSCTVVDPIASQTTLWTVNTTAELCVLANALSAQSGYSDTCGPFTARFGTRNGNNFPSTLTVTATAELDNAFVQCFGPLTNATVGNGTLQIVGPPSTPVITLTEDDITTSGNVNSLIVLIHWTIVDTYPDFISQYNLTISPAAQPCGSSCVVQPEEFEVTLSIGQEYTFRVRAENCDNSQTGPLSDSLTVQLKVPGSPEDCTPTPTYDQATGLLQSITVTWEEVPSPGAIAPGITGNLSGYEVTFVPDPGVPMAVAVGISACSAGMCQYKLPIEDSPPPSYSSLTVAGMNMIGIGAARVCTSQTISKMNNLIEVSIDTSSDPVTVECRFLDGFQGQEQCTITYGTEPNSLTESATSAQFGGAGDTVTVSLSSLQFSPDATYYYTVTAGAVAQAVGTFRSSCSAEDLGNTTASTDTRCGEGMNSASIENGVVCYGLTTPGSVAMYLCESGYQVDTNHTRECKNDGQWNLPEPMCVTTEAPPAESSGSSDLEPWIIAVIAVGGLLLAGGMVVLVVLGIVFIKPSRKTDISPESPVMEYREVPEGKSFEPDGDKFQLQAIKSTGDGDVPDPGYQTVMAATNPTFGLFSEMKEKLQELEIVADERENEPLEVEQDAERSAIGAVVGGHEGRSDDLYNHEMDEKSGIAQQDPQLEQEGDGDGGKQVPDKHTKETESPSPTRSSGSHMQTRTYKETVSGIPEFTSGVAASAAVSMAIPIYAPVAPPKVRSSVGGRASRQRHYCVVMNDYSPALDDEITLKRGELVRITSTVDTKRWQGTTDGKKGFFPTSTVLGVNDGDTVMRAKYEFVPQDYGEMALKEGQIIVVSKPPADGWQSGKSLDGRGGYLDGRFPEEYAEKMQTITL